MGLIATVCGEGCFAISTLHKQGRGSRIGVVANVSSLALGVGLGMRGQFRQHHFDLAKNRKLKAELKRLLSFLANFTLAVDL